MRHLVPLYNRQKNFLLLLVGGQSFVLEVFAELRHVVGVYAENAERFQRSQMLRAGKIGRQFYRGTALQAQVISF